MIMERSNDFSKPLFVSDFIDHMTIAAKIEKALEQFNKGEYMTSEELDEEIKKWD